MPNNTIERRTKDNDYRKGNKNKHIHTTKKTKD
jgi:hypothetical protein